MHSKPTLVAIGAVILLAMTCSCMLAATAFVVYKAHCEIVELKSEQLKIKEHNKILLIENQRLKKINEARKIQNTF